MTYQTHTHSTQTYLNQMAIKQAYLTSTYFSPRFLAKLQGYRAKDESLDMLPRMGAHGFVSAIWMWLRLCVYVVTGHSDPFKSNVEFIQRPHLYGRARRHRDTHFAKRGTVPARRLTPFYYFGSRLITRGQFLERLCRLSCNGRIRVYHMIYYAHRLVRYAKLAMFARGDFRAPNGLCEAHLWPD